MPRLGQTGHPPTWKSARTSPSGCRKRGKSHQKRLGSCALGRPASRGKYVQQTSLHDGRAEQVAQKKVAVADRLQQLQGSVDAMGVAWASCSGGSSALQREGAGVVAAGELGRRRVPRGLGRRRRPPSNGDRRAGEEGPGEAQVALERQEAAARIKAAFYRLKMEDLPLLSVFWQRLIGRHEGTTVASEVEG